MKRFWIVALSVNLLFSHTKSYSQEHTCTFEDKTETCSAGELKDFTELEKPNEHPKFWQNARMIWNDTELSIYGLYVLNSFTKLDFKSLSSISNGLIGTLSFFDNLVMLDAALLMTEYLKCGPEEVYEVDLESQEHRFHEAQKETQFLVEHIDTFLDNEDTKREGIYGSLVFAYKACEAAKVCTPGGFAQSLLFQYYAVDNAAVTPLKELRKSLNISAWQAPSKALAYKQPLMDLSTIYPIANFFLWTSGLCQITAFVKQSPNLAVISQVRATFIATYFSLLGLNKLPDLIEYITNLNTYLEKSSP